MKCLMGEGNADKSDAIMEELMEAVVDGNWVEGSRKYVAHSQAIDRIVRPSGMSPLSPYQRRKNGGQ
jgi:hypothetical protein